MTRKILLNDDATFKAGLDLILTNFEGAPEEVIYDLVSTFVDDYNTQLNLELEEEPIQVKEYVKEERFKSSFELLQDLVPTSFSDRENPKFIKRLKLILKMNGMASEETYEKLIREQITDYLRGEEFAANETSKRTSSNATLQESDIESKQRKKMKAKLKHFFPTKEDWHGMEAYIGGGEESPYKTISRYLSSRMHFSLYKIAKELDLIQDPSGMYTTDHSKYFQLITEDLYKS